MSVKRQATTELNHDNWDQEDSDEHEEMGSFKPASKDVVEKRVIRTAKRRTANAGDEAKKGVFSSFGGFSKAPPSTFDFLANLTNGSTKPANGTPPSKNDNNVFNSSLASGSPGGGLFSVPVSSTSTKSSFAMPTSQSSSLFGTANSTSPSSVFTATKADSTISGFSFKPQNTDNDNSIKPNSTSSVSSTMFGVPPANEDIKKTLFSTAATSSPFKMQSLSSTKTSPSSTNLTPETKKEEDKNEDSDKKMKYYTKLKGLNESVSDWIKKHVDKTPLCILSPIFKDYEKYLKEIQGEYHGPTPESSTNKHSEGDKASETKSEPAVAKSPFSSNGNSIFSNLTSMKSNASPFGTQSSQNSFGEKSTNPLTSPAASTSSKPAGGFSFGVNTSPQCNTLTTNAAPAPFSFGTGKPFSFNNFNAPKPAATENATEEEDQPPKVEFTPVVEKDTVYDKKCKIFVKKDGHYVEGGVGTLYIKKIEDSGKHQLLVRANTNLGNILVNLILASAIPTQRMGKNNVMMICIPTPDAKPPPTSILIRVKTTEEADELLETLNKYKV